MADRRAVEAMPLERALSPIPGSILLSPEGKDFCYALVEQGVDEMEGKFVLVELEGYIVYYLLFLWI